MAGQEVEGSAEEITGVQRKGEVGLGLADISLVFWIAHWLR